MWWYPDNFFFFCLVCRLAWKKNSFVAMSILLNVCSVQWSIDNMISSGCWYYSMDPVLSVEIHSNSCLPSWKLSSLCNAFIAIRLWVVLSVWNKLRTREPTKITPKMTIIVVSEDDQVRKVSHILLTRHTSHGNWIIIENGFTQMVKPSQMELYLVCR